MIRGAMGRGRSMCGIRLYVPFPILLPSPYYYPLLSPTLSLQSCPSSLRPICEDRNKARNADADMDVCPHVYVQWHLDCCNPENNYDNGGWMIFNAIFGWTNSATYGSVIGYVMYWVAVMGALGGLKWKEVRWLFLPHDFSSFTFRAGGVHATCSCASWVLEQH